MMQNSAVQQAPRQTSVTNLFKREKSIDQTSIAPSLKKNMHSNDIMLNFSRLPSCQMFRDLAPKIIDINQRVNEQLSEIKDHSTLDKEQGRLGTPKRDTVSNYSGYLGVEQFG